ncbi:MAG: IS481 family transposase [Candidatus Nanopelagicales bacterium]
MSHRNAPLNAAGRRILVDRVCRQGRPVSHVAKEMGISRQTAHKWINRYRQFGEPGLQDRSSAPRVHGTRTPRPVERQVVRLRQRRRQGRDWIAERTGASPRTVSRILARYAMPALSDIDPVTGQRIRGGPVTSHRYERAHPGDLLHIDVKKLGRIPDGGGWRLHGFHTRHGGDRNHRVGFDYIHTAVDDHSRVAYAEVLPDEKGVTAAGFLLRAGAWFAEHGVRISEILTDNHKSYTVSHDFADAVAALGVTHRTIKAYCPWQNGKVERFHRTLALGWAYAQPYLDNDQRTQALPIWLDYYNLERKHYGIGGQTPISRLSLSTTC